MKNHFIFLSLQTPYCQDFGSQIRDQKAFVQSDCRILLSVMYEERSVDFLHADKHQNCH